MDLTWRDAIATLALVLILLAYSVYLFGPAIWLLSSAWATAAAILVVGLGGMVVGVGGEAHTRSRELLHVITRRAGSVFGIIALVIGVLALVADSGYVLRLLVADSILAWLAILISHI